MFLKHLVRAAALVAAIAAATGAEAQNAAPFSLDGRVIRFIHGQAAGGVADTESRLLAQHITRFLPGSPATVVQSVAGAGGIRMLEFGAQLDPTVDLTVMLMTASMPFSARSGALDGIFDPRQSIWIGSFARNTTICVSSASANINSPDDLKSRRVTAGAQNATGGIVATYMIMNQALGFMIEPVVGYDSFAAMALAVARGEIDMLCGPYSAYATTLQAIVDDGSAKLLLYVSADPRDDIAAPYLFDLPVLDGQAEFLRAAIAAVNFPRAFMVPAGTDPAFVALLREAFAATVADPLFLAETATYGVDVLPRTAADLVALTDALYATPDALVAEIGTYLAN